MGRHELWEYFGQDRLSRHLGIELLDVSTGTARARLEIDDMHRNSLGTVHGGTIFALADTVFAAASNSHGRVAVAINAGISYVKAATRGTLSAEAIETSLGPKLATYRVEVRDDAKALVAIFEGMVYRKKDTIPFV